MPAGGEGLSARTHTCTCIVAHTQAHVLPPFLYPSPQRRPARLDWPPHPISRVLPPSLLSVPLTLSVHSIVYTTPPPGLTICSSFCSFSCCAAACTQRGLKGRAAILTSPISQISTSILLAGPTLLCPRLQVLLHSRLLPGTSRSTRAH